MEKADFVHCIAPLFYTAPYMVSGKTHYKQLRGWNIILATSLSETIREQYQVQLEAEDFIRSETIDDLYLRVLLKH